MGDHHRGELLAADDLVGEPDDLLGAPGVEGGGVLVEQEELGPPVGGHEQGQGLALAAGEAADRVVEPVFQAHAERPDPVAELGNPAPGDRAAEAARKAAAGGQGEVLGDREAPATCRRAGPERPGRSASRGGARASRVISRPASRIVPASTGNDPATAFRVVLLPDPLVPITTTKLPGSIVRSTPRRARTSSGVPGLKVL